MCSIGEDDFDDEGGLHAMKSETIPNEEIPKGLCKKCNINDAIVKLHFREAECKECFLANVRHKFRATLGSSKILPKDADVLLVFDGSAESIVLLDMLHYAQTQNTFKRLHCNAKILYIDESCLENSFAENLIEIFNFLKQYDFKSYIVSISKTAPIEFVNFKEFKAKVESTEQDFVNSFDQIKNLTSKQEFLKNFRKNVIYYAAENLGINYVFLPNISTYLAAELLTNISLGRGASTALDVSLLDNRNGAIKIIRPLKDLNEYEVMYYLKLNNLKPLRNMEYGEIAGSHTSIQNLTKNFVENLQKNFASTVSTVFRTGDKMAPNRLNEINKSLRNGIENDLKQMQLDPKKCSFCHSYLDYFDSKTLLAIEFSRLLSENPSNSKMNNFEDLENKAKRKLYATDDVDIMKLCHGCRNIYHDCLDKNLLHQ